MDFNFKITTFENDLYQTVDYIPHPKQREFHVNLNTFRYNILRKSRAMGVTTTVIIESILRISNIENYSIGYVPPNYTAGVIFLNKVRDLFESQPSKITKLKKPRSTKLQFENGSQVMLVNSPDNLIGQKFDWIIFDDCFNTGEIRHILDISRRMDGERTLIATPPRGNNTFKRYYLGAVTRVNEFMANDYLWYDHPSFSKDIEWVRGNVRIPHDNSDITTLRLLEFGFHRESPTYTRYLKMFGNEDEEDIGNFDSYATSTY